MKKNKLYILFLSCITSATAFAGVVAHNNYVCAYDNANGTKVIISLDTSNYSYVITAGQPFGGIKNIPTTSGDNPGCIDILSGRKKSTQVVNWVKKQMQAEDVDWVKRNMAASVTYKDNDNLASELNIAVRSNITLEFRDPLNFTTKTYYCPKMIVAQGSTKSSAGRLFPYINNIWLFSNTQNSKYRPNKTIFNCYDTYGKLQKIAAYRDSDAIKEFDRDGDYRYRDDSIAVGLIKTNSSDDEEDNN